MPLRWPALLPDRLPVVVGTGQLRSNRERTVEAAREPLDLLLEALRSAASPEVLRGVDAVHAVRVASWHYDELAATVAAAIGASPRTLVDTGLGGHHPVRLLDQAAARIWAGDSDVAVVVGAEAQASVTLLRKEGGEPPWSRTPGGRGPLDLDDLGSTAMQVAALLAPTRLYPLFENRLTADLGQSPEEGARWSAQMYADLSRIGHPVAWDPAPRTVDEIQASRTVCEPYPLLVNAMPHVDQAAAVVVMSLAAARRHDLPVLAHVWGGAGADDDRDVLARPDLGRSVALEQALDRTLARTGPVDLVDVYSCFPVVPKLVGRHLGLPRETVLSVTGGHGSFGGPLNSYSLHALATVAQGLTGTAMVHANGGYLTYQHAVVLSDRPHPDGYVGDPSPGAVQHAPVAVVPLREPTEVVVETATVEHGRDGTPQQAFVVARTAEGARVAVQTPAGDVSAADALSLVHGQQVGRRLVLNPVSDGTATPL